MSFEPLNTLLPTAARHTGISNQIVIAQALTRAHRILVELLGKEAGEKLQPAYIQHKTLYIATIDPPLAWHVGMHQDHIIKSINEQSPYPLVQQIRVIQ